MQNPSNRAMCGGEKAKKQLFMHHDGRVYGIPTGSVFKKDHTMNHEKHATIFHAAKKLTA